MNPSKEEKGKKAIYSPPIQMLAMESLMGSKQFTVNSKEDIMTPFTYSRGHLEGCLLGTCRSPVDFN